jgi:phosphoribosylglycinamide formyltransferase-1
MAAPRRLGILISGRGSNMLAIGDAIAAGRLDATIAVVVSSRAGAPGLERAAAAGIPTAVIAPKDHASREACDRAIVDVLRAHDVELVCLAGYMRLITPAFVEAFPNAILNVHPSLLPAFPGLHGPADALAHGVKLTGCTVFLVDTGVDAGPIVAQRAVPVADDDDVSSLHERIKVVERSLLVDVVAALTAAPYTVNGRKVVLG